ncbi:4243_t:CDS:2 [Entrophospora sp. SA101]|nr:4243_t:CDS:2 [Entrophospora sp. SA101]
MDKDPECPGHKELAPGEQRSTWIYSTDTYLQSQPQKTINQSNFKESYTKPNKPNYLPWILGGIAGLGLIVGLSLYDYEFVSQLKQNKINPEQYAHCKNQTIQEQLDYFYNKSQKIDGYEASILTQLTINNCPQLEKINIRNSETNKRKDAKVQAIYNLFADEQGEVETQKQQAIEELENELEGKAFNKRIGVELRQKQKELDKIELRLEKIIEEEKPALMKKLKMDNEN